MKVSPRLAALGLALFASPAQAQLADPVRAMIEAAIATGDADKVDTVAAIARTTNPDHVAEIDALLAGFSASEIVPVEPAPPPPKPTRVLLDAAIASGKDRDVETVGKLAKAASPEDAAEIDQLLADYRARREREKAAAAAAARTKLANAKFWQNWKGEGQIGAMFSSGNTDAAGINLGVALKRQGLNWDQRFLARTDYQRTNGRKSTERYLVEYEPQVRLGERAFVFGLGRWERDFKLGFTARWNTSAGLGYKLFDDKDLSLSVKAGPAWRETVYRPGRGQDESELTGLGGLDFGWQMSPTVKLTQVASTTVSERNVTAASQTALNAKINGALSARMTYAAEVDSNPPPGVEKLDTQTRFTLVYGF